MITRSLKYNDQIEKGRFLMLIILVSLIIGFLFSSAVLLIVTKQMKLNDHTFVTAMKTAGVIAVAGILFNLLADVMPESLQRVMAFLSFVLISVSLSIYMIKVNYKLEIKKAVIVWAIWLALTIVMAIIIGIAVGVIIPFFAR
jgi:hypothetical protein